MSIRQHKHTNFINNRIFHFFFIVTLSASALLTSTSALQADPCGMVPPVYVQGENPITRVGAQRTYVYFKDGVETFVIRPGFSGKVDEFGMLIPFPSVPAIRKVPDHIFPHIAKAIDPPEVVIDLRPIPVAPTAAPGGGFDKSDSKPQDDGLRFETVKVLKKEAVGMYEVVVLAAGSAKALKKWIDEHGYRYPTGMDDVCNEYVKAKWCFVAVKTKVGQKDGVSPKAGKRSLKSKLPSGSTFDGNVQAMGFRFHSEKLVVPMRLSAFNKGKLRNIVYILSDTPQKIRSIPEEYVVRQLSGSDLHRNVTGPLPLRIINGTEAEIPAWRRKNLKQQRDPKPHNAAAKELFATDLLATRNGKLSLPHEELEKAYLAIGEELGLRGKEIDKENTNALQEQSEKVIADAIVEVKNMNLTVIDGDFPREVIAKQNLAFAKYRMPANRNKKALYDANKMAPGGTQKGILKLGALENKPTSNSESQSQLASNKTWISIAIVAFGFAIFCYRRKQYSRSRTSCSP